jgi:hypothetical protein
VWYCLQRERAGCACFPSDFSRRITKTLILRRSKMGRHWKVPALAVFVHVQSKNQKAVEFREPYQVPRDCCQPETTYIECHSDDVFSIKFAVRPSKLPKDLKGENLGFFAEIDGKRVSYGAVCGPRGFKPSGGTWEYSLEGEFTTTASGTTFRKFKFAAIQIGSSIPSSFFLHILPGHNTDKFSNR